MVHDRGGERDLAPVIPLFAGIRVDRDGDDLGEACDGYSRGDAWHSTWMDEDDDLDDLSEEDPYGDDGSSAVLSAALDRLLRRLRRSGLSVAEATDQLVADGVERVVAEAVVADLVGKRWLGDAVLAEQLVHTALTKRREGRRAIGQVLAKRRIPREIADAALAALPDDDAERALEFARQKAAGFRGLPVDVAIRRLVGQLQRRGYPPGVAMTAARLALADAHG